MADHNERWVLNHLIEMCRDEELTLRFAAEHVTNPAVRTLFGDLASRRAEFAAQLVPHAERLGGTDSFTEYRAFNAHAGKGSGRVLLRVYSVDPYATSDERAAELRRISNGFKALNCLPSHPAIQAARDFFPTEDEDRFVFEPVQMAVTQRGRPDVDRSP